MSKFKIAPRLHSLGAYLSLSNEQLVMNLLSLVGKLSHTSNSMSLNAVTAVKAEKKALFAWYVSAAKARPIVRSVLELIRPVVIYTILATFLPMSFMPG